MSEFLKFKLTFYSSLQDRIVSGLMFLLIASLSLPLLLVQFTKPFTFEFFTLSMVMIYVLSFIAFFFLKFHLTPVLQIYQSEIIVSRFRRRVIPLNEISKFTVHAGAVEIILSNNLVIDFPVSNKHSLTVVLEGKNFLIKRASGP